MMLTWCCWGDSATHAHAGGADPSAQHTAGGDTSADAAPKETSTAYDLTKMAKVHITNHGHHAEIAAPIAGAVAIAAITPAPTTHHPAAAHSVSPSYPPNPASNHNYPSAPSSHHGYPPAPGSSPHASRASTAVTGYPPAPTTNYGHPPALSQTHSFTSAHHTSTYPPVPSSHSFSSAPHSTSAYPAAPSSSAFSSTAYPTSAYPQAPTHSYPAPAHGYPAVPVVSHDYPAGVSPVHGYPSAPVLQQSQSQKFPQAPSSEPPRAWNAVTGYS